MNTTHVADATIHGEREHFLSGHNRIVSLTQKRLRLTLPAGKDHGWLRLEKQRDLNRQETESPHQRTRDLLAAHLKYQAREVMRAVTQCQPAAIPHAVAHLRDVLSTCHFVIKHRLVDEAERVFSGSNLIHCHTLLDYTAAMDITVQNHREPAFASRERREHEEIITRLDIIAAKLAGAATAPGSEVEQ